MEPHPGALSILEQGTPTPEVTEESFLHGMSTLALALLTDQWKPKRKIPRR